METTTNAIRGFKGLYRFLSNFWTCQVTHDGIPYPSAEHAYQAAKTLERPIRYFMATIPKAGQVKRQGRKIPLRPDWEEVKLQVMEEIVRDKFTRNYLLGKRLLETGDAELIEDNHWNDTFWGVCGGVGENHLGKILMKIREELQQNGT